MKTDYILLAHMTRATMTIDDIVKEQVQLLRECQIAINALLKVCPQLGFYQLSPSKTITKLNDELALRYRPGEMK